MVSTLLEKIARKRIDEFRAEMNFVSERQNGFRERKAYVTNLLDSCEKSRSIVNGRAGWWMVYLGLLEGL